MPEPESKEDSTDGTSSQAQDLPQPSPLTRIVGLGASAGGLAPLEAFLSKVPSASGMAYVVVQHLDPTHKALLGELLARVTEMPVREATQGMSIEADHVYVIPPDTELSIVGNALKLAEPVATRGMRLPIDVLFSSLARARGEQAITVLLSGMGADGMLGMQAVKTTGGLTLVQTPDTAQFDAMPRSAIAAGCADIVVSPEAMAPRIADFLANDNVAPAVAATSDSQAESWTEPLQRIFDCLKWRMRHDFSLYKSSTVQRRIERRMSIHSLASLALYADYLEANVQEVDLLFKELLIGVTSFFRDSEAWEYLAQEVLPDFLGQQREGAGLRAWVVGCSTGEEAYTLAMVFSEAIERLPSPHGFRLQIFASDLSPDAITSARRGQFPLSIRGSMSQERLTRFFDERESHYEVKKSLREMVLFAQHDVVLDPPFTKLDLIACRNLLIYFDPMLQRRLMPFFHYSLRPGGLLMLGSSETVGRFHRLFAPLESRLRIYRRQDEAAITGPDFLLKSFPPLSRIEKEHTVPPSEGSNLSGGELQRAADDMLLQVYAPAAVVLNADGDIVYISGRTGKYLEPAAGKANWNIHAMAREGLRRPLLGALKQAGEQREPLHLYCVRVDGTDGTHHIDVTVQAFREVGPLRGMAMVIFRDVPSGGARKASSEGDVSMIDDDDAALQGDAALISAAEIQRYQDEIETLREEARASREALQTSNEELQSTNEELQSTNEELTTSKEEMQSMNEELQTINSELQAKLDDLALAQSDMQNVLNSIEIAILFLDQNLNVRRFTDRASKIINLRDSDVGRPLSDLTSALQYPGMHEDAQETLRTLAASEKQVSTDDGRSFSIRIMPYRRIDNVIDGVVITLLDISDSASG